MNNVIPGFEYKSDHGITRLRSHEVVLRGSRVTLRPLTEDDWKTLLRWNNDTAVMEYADRNVSEARNLAEVQAIYRWISTHAHCFVIVAEGRSIGECWLQEVNLQRIADQFPGDDLRRIDLLIGEKDLWDRGYGSESIALLVDFGFGQEAADAIFAVGISADNVRSLRAFEKCGFIRHAVTHEENGTLSYDFVVNRETHQADPGHRIRLGIPRLLRSRHG